VRIWPWPLLLVFVGCERGCLSNWLAERGLGHPAAGASAKGPTDLRGIDCSDGLARCQDGVVEVSIAYHYPDPCSGPAEKCRCPWERLGDCPGACAADGVELVVERERALRQLCAARPDEDFARRSGDAAAVVPCEATFACHGSTVIACGPPPAAVATCARGCAHEGDALEEEVDTVAASALLCSR
jgi:hypothetical protein